MSKQEAGIRVIFLEIEINNFSYSLLSESLSVPWWNIIIEPKMRRFSLKIKGKKAYIQNQQSP